MAPDKPPAFQFYARDWLADARVQMMTLAQRGAYIHLLAFAWAEDGLPDDPDALARLLGVTREHFDAELWPALEPCWQRRGRKLRNPRLEEVRSDLETYRQSRSEAGRRGAEARWQSKATAKRKDG